MAWYKWHQDDLPCQFSVERAQENRDYLERLLGADFIGAQTARRVANPLLRTWDTTGAGAFLEVNSLAEDLRSIEGKPGFAPVLRDLCDEQLSLPTWHVIRTAALFERACAGAVLEFVTADADEAPDLIVNIGGDRIPVEAKLLAQSEDELRFISVASRIKQALLDDGPATPVQTAIYVILKEPVTSDVSSEAISFCTDAIDRYEQTAVCERGRLCNVFLEPADVLPGLSDYRSVYVMAPVPATEAFRARLAALGITQSMRRPREIGDNAFIESFLHTLKADVIHGRTFDNAHALRTAISHYTRRYNRTRMHSSLDYRSPIDYERLAA